jgi:cytochrome c-type biogenesis protein CcmH/NrfF
LRALRAIVVAVSLAFAAAAGAVVFEQREFESEAQLTRYKTLIHELR